MTRLSREAQDKTLLGVAVAAAGLIHVTIAGSQILLGLGVALMLIFRRKLRFPRIWIPLLCLFLWTVAADLVCPDPWGGRAQIRKFFVFLFIPLIYGVFAPQVSRTFYLLAAWVAAATASGMWGLVQFWLKREHARQTGQDFYVAYLERRITGFESHWMTFGALQLSVLSLLLAHWFFSKRQFPTWVYCASGIVLSTAIVLGWTRSIWIAAIPSVVYLIWFWRPKMILLVPVVVVLAFAVAPGGTRDRLTSLFHPHGETDSNRHRVVTFRTGIEMVKAHPLFGIGPEQVGRQFNSFIPSDIQKPLPVGYYGHLHNTYVQYAAERGLPGLFCIMWLIGMAVWDFITASRRVSRPSTELFLLHGGVAVIIGILVGGLFEYNLGDSEVLMMFVCVLAIGYAAVKSATSPSIDLSKPRSLADQVLSSNS